MDTRSTEIDDLPLAVFHIFRSGSSRLWYFHLKAPNGEIICASEGYHNRDDVIELKNRYFPMWKLKEDEDVTDR